MCNGGGVKMSKYIRNIQKMKSRRRSENQRPQVRNTNPKTGKAVSLNTVLYRRVILEL